VAAKNKPVRGTWVEALDMGGLGAQSGKYLASEVECYRQSTSSVVLLYNIRVYGFWQITPFHLG
jgi:hypothetical protein